MNEGFWLEDEEPRPWGEDLGEIVEMLRGEEGKKNLPLKLEINSPDGLCTLTITNASEDDMEPGDMMMKGVLGKYEHPIEIWWNGEINAGHVDMSCTLEGYLERFAQEWDLLPPENRSLEDVEVHELSELCFDAASHLSSTLDCGDIENELSIMCVVYGDGADSALATTLRGTAHNFTGHDGNGDQIEKYVLDLVNSSELYHLIHQLQQINTSTELTFDLTIFWWGINN